MLSCVKIKRTRNKKTYMNKYFYRLSIMWRRRARRRESARRPTLFATVVLFVPGIPRGETTRLSRIGCLHRLPEGVDPVSRPSSFSRRPADLRREVPLASIEIGGYQECASKGI